MIVPLACLVRLSRPFSKVVFIFKFPLGKQQKTNKKQKQTKQKKQNKTKQIALA